MKVLVPVDGSDNSAKALKEAIQFARKEQADLYVISVIPWIGGMEDHEITPKRRERYTEEMQQLAESALAKAGKILGEADVPCKLSKAVDTSVSVPDAIIDFAEAEKVDIIVMGSRGLSPSSRFKLGSTASQVIKHCPCSVYLVKTPN